MRRRKSFFRQLTGWGVYIIMVAGFTYFIITFIGQRTKVSGDSMNPTLSNGDNLIVDKLSYRFRDPKRYDIIVFPYNRQKHIYYIKRIIGLPGETLRIVDGKVYVDRKELKGDFGNEPIADPGIAVRGIKLGRDEYFVLGDNRNHSSDSRKADVGILKKGDLLGRAWVRIWPLSEFGVLEHGE